MGRKAVDVFAPPFACYSTAMSSLPQSPRIHALTRALPFPPQVVKPARKGTSVPSVTPPYYTNMIFLFLWIPCYKDNIFYYIHETSQKIICQNLWQTNPFIACQQNRTPIKTELIHVIYPDQGAEKLFPENRKSIRSQRGSRRHLPHSRLPRKIPP